MMAGTYVAIAVFILGITFHAGYLSARVAHLEEWKGEAKVAFDAIHAALRELRDAVLTSGHS